VELYEEVEIDIVGMGGGAWSATGGSVPASTVSHCSWSGSYPSVAPRHAAPPPSSC
jgi:hypothetical protein